MKAVLAAAVWQNPRVLILDEPTNYLDRDGLGALMEAGGEENIQPFGIEAQRLLRLEKGHIIIGQDTDNHGRHENHGRAYVFLKFWLQNGSRKS